MMLRLGEVPTMVVSSRDAAREVMRLHDTAFATRPLSATMRVLINGGRNIALAPYGDYWRQIRKIAVTELLTEGGLQFPLDMDAIKVLIFLTQLPKKVHCTQDIFGAGSETSSTTLGWAIAELIRNPKAMHKATAEVRHALASDGAVSEAALGELHYLNLGNIPAAPTGAASSATRVPGIVPAVTQVLVNVWALGHDERYWPDHPPDEFQPERFNNGEAAAADFRGTNFELLPFGAGRRMCPGLAFGLANVELPLASLLFHFDWEVPGLANPADLDMTETFGITVRRKSDLLLCPILRMAVPQPID
uniref:Cytochrome P450 n=1 Tax=Leersia perrieri TaxID=77586 RepID=A0A0D9V067_9ORYZ